MAPRSRPTFIFIAVIAVLASVAGLGLLFRSSIGGTGRTEAAAVVLSAPPEFDVVTGGSLEPGAAAGLLLDRAAKEPGKARLGVDYTAPDGSRVFLLLDRVADLLDERTAGITGTRLQVLWPRQPLVRLARAQAGGGLAVPGLPPEEKKNLYH